MVSTDLFIKSNLSCCVELIFFVHIFLCYIIIYSYFLNPFEHSVALVTLILHLFTVYFSLLYCFISSWLVSISTFFLVPLRVCASECKWASSHSACLVFNFLPVAWLTPQIANKVVAFSHETAAVADARCFVQTKTNTEIRTNINK